MVRGVRIAIVLTFSSGRFRDIRFARNCIRTRSSRAVLFYLICDRGFSKKETFVGDAVDINIERPEEPGRRVVS